MTSIESKKSFATINSILIILSLQISFCTGQVNEKPANNTTENGINNQPINSNQSTTFPQIHTNLNGMVMEFVRTMYQDKKGNYWFGTNGNGIIRYDGKTLEKISIEGLRPLNVVREIVEDKAGQLWFGTDYGLIKYDGEKFTIYSEKDGLQNDEIWGLTIDKSGLIWVGSGGLVILMAKSLPLFYCRKQKLKIQNLCFLINWFLNFGKIEMERCGLLPMEMEFSNTKVANSFI
jgi:ligand-binding sensor domain-containing protein